MIIIFFVQEYAGQICPQLQTFHNPLFDDGFVVSSFLRIPKTNILLINTIYDKRLDSSIVYYNDMSSSSGEIINVIKPDYVIMYMDYITQTDRIIIANFQKIIFADPYTLQSVNTLPIQNIEFIYIIPNTNYALLTRRKNLLFIIDVKEVKIVLTLDNSMYPDAKWALQYNSKLYTLKNNDQVIITSNDYGIVSWNIDLKTKSFSYNGQMNYTSIPYGNTIRSYTKHPTEDILFIGGKNVEVIALRINNIKTNDITRLFKINLYSNNKNYITNILFTYVYYDNIRYPVIWAGDNTYLYNIYLNISEDAKSVQTANYYDQYLTHSYIWYVIEESPLIIMSAIEYVTIFNYQTQYYNFKSDGFSRRFMRQKDGLDLYIIAQKTVLYLYERGNLGFTYKEYKPDLSYQFRNGYNSISRVKGCEECLLLKIGDQDAIHRIMTTEIYPFKTKDMTIDITTNYKLKWDDINLTLDPFKIQGAVWVVVAFPKKSANEYLFQLINAQSNNQRYFLKSSNTDENKQKTSFALASIKDEQSVEIIGIDVIGTVYFWDLKIPSLDLNFPNLDSKKSIKFNFCQNSEIGEIFQYEQIKRLIVACGDNNVYSLNLDSNDGDKQFIVNLTSMPLALRAFSGPKIIVAGDKFTGIAYVYKFNTDTLLFEFFLKIQTGKFQDIIIAVELLKDNTLWVQYNYSNLFYSLQDCLSNKDFCTYCAQQYSFKATNTYDQYGIYGSGAAQSPFSTSANFITTMVKAQYYKELISGVSNMKVEIIIEPNLILQLQPNLLSFDFNSIISLTFKSKQQGSKATLKYISTLSLENYNSVTLLDISIQYESDKSPKQCGLNFANIPSVILNNIQLISSSPLLYSCQQITVQNAYLQIEKYDISNENFSSNSALISTFNSTQVSIKNLNLNDCVLGDQFSILYQGTNVEASIETINISRNKCQNNAQNNNIISSLFSAGLFKVKNIHIIGNQFCKKIIFSTRASIQHENQVFEFEDIEVKDNVFQTRTNYLFFDSLYSMISSPSHELKLKKVTFSNNQLTKKFDQDLSIASFIQTNKIQKITIESSSLEYHFDIQFSKIEYTDTITIDYFKCTNEKKDDDSFNKSIPNQTTIGCLQLNEVKEATINKLYILNKKIYDNNLFVMENYDINQANLSITNIQSQFNTQSNPIFVGSSYQIIITIDFCEFKKNVLNGILDSLTYSTTAIYVENYVGQVFIKNSQFEDSYSKSIYGFVYVQSYVLQLDTVIFKKSTFSTTNDPNTQSLMFLQNGGMMNLKVKSLKILNSSFSQATSAYGSFIYIDAFRDELFIDINNTHFEEGYAQFDGSGLFIDTHGSYMTFNCIDCFFNNLYNLSPLSSTIGMENYVKGKTDKQNIINFKGGNIINVFGQEDNYFIQATNSHIQFNDITKIYSESFNSDSLVHKQYLKVQIKQQSTLLNLKNSIGDFKGCTISKIEINNQQAKFPLLINSNNSTINLEKVQVIDSKFITSAIYAENTTVFLKSTTFKNVTQQMIKKRVLDIGQDEQPSENGSSLIIISNGKLQVEQKSSFQDIECLNNCNGGTFQLLNSNFIIKELTVSNSKVIKYYIKQIKTQCLQQSKATFGGSIFIKGIKDKSNIISGSKFDKCQSQSNGGAIYFHSLATDKFILVIDDSDFTNNVSKEGKGGGISIESDIMKFPDQNITMINSRVIKNKAKIGGGIQETNISVIDNNTIIFEDNISELFGNNKNSYPTQLKQINQKEFEAKNSNVKFQDGLIIVDDFRSGGTLTGLEFQFYNNDTELITPITKEEQKNYNINAKYSPNTKHIQAYAINGNTTSYYEQDQKIFNFKELQLIGTPGSSAILQFKSDQIQILNPTTNSFENSYSFPIQINFRNCTFGEQKSNSSGYSELVECSICSQGFYSFTVDKSCQECPTGAVCEGGTSLVTKSGYWRKTNVSSSVIKCSNLQENCVGGSYGDSICYEGHIGALCEECDIYGEVWGKPYSKSAKYACTSCDEIKKNTWIVSLMTVWTLCSMTLAIKGDIEISKQRAAAYAIQKHLRRRSEVPQRLEQHQRSRSRFTISSRQTLINQTNEQNISNNDEDKSGIYIKMFTNYLQIVGSIATFNLNIPSGIFELPQSVGEPLKQTMNSLDCALQDLDVGVPIIYLRLIFSLFVPILYMVLFLIGITLFSLIKKEKKFPWYILSTAIMFLIIYIQPDLVAQIISLISCRDVGETNYILANVSFECYTDEHIFYALVLIIPLLLIWVFILPFTLFLMLRKNKQNLNNIQIKLKYGFLYREYKNHAFYWEFLKMAEKIAIILSLNFYSQNIIIKGILVFVIICVYGILSLIIEPYKDKDVNQVDVNSTNVCALTVLLGLFIYNNPFNYFVYSSLAFIVLLNLWLIVKIIAKIIEGYIPKMEQGMQAAFHSLSKQIPCFNKCIRKQKPQKRINPVLKKKMQDIFKKYLNMTPKQKKAFILKVIESQLNETHKHIFGEGDQSEGLIRFDVKSQITSLCELQKQKSTQSSLMKEKSANNLLFDNNQQSEYAKSETSPESTPIIFLNGLSTNRKGSQNESDPILLKNKSSTPNKQVSPTQIAQIELIKEEQIEVDFHETEQDLQE